jgi:hypothetical protein
VTCAIKWNTLSIEEWEEKFSRLPHSNILQSYSYARAFCPYEKLGARWGVIEIDGKEAGLVQLFEAGMFKKMIHGVIVDRGPLWFEGFGTAIHVKRVFDELNRQFPARLGRKRRFLPEIEDGPTARKMVEQTGLQRLGSGYQTIWLDSTKSEEELRAALRGNWRGHLNKAEKSGLEARWDMEGARLPVILPVYATDKEARDYGGPSPEFLKSYASYLLPRKEMLIAEACVDDHALAFIMVALHGRSATYLAGWNSEEGRKYSAHHFLLWNAVKMLKEKGIREFDLGGINDDEGAKGLKDFKEGIGGRAVRYVGHYA